VVADRLPIDLTDNTLTMGDLLAFILHLVRVLAEGALSGSGELAGEVGPQVVLHFVVCSDLFPEVVLFLAGRLHVVDDVSVSEVASIVGVLN